MKIKIPYPVIVEGKYDKIKLSSVIDANIITSDGFGVFNSAEKQEMIRRLAEAGKVIILTDSDGAGLVIRNFFRGILKKEDIINLYIPCVKGKERRKDAPSAEGLLGVEGIDADKLRELFLPFESDAKRGREVTRTDLYADGLLGSDGSAQRRRALLKKMNLPVNLSSGAMLEAINMLYGYERYKELL